MPPAFASFVADELRLAPLYPRQRAFVTALLGDDPIHVFDARDPQVAVALWGKGSGKDYVCSIVVCYLLRVLLCLRDPQAFFGLAPGEAIDIVNVAYNAEQSKRVFFAKLRARLERWSWLREHYNLVEGGRRQNGYDTGRGTIQVNDDSIELPGHIRAWSRHAQNESYEGLNILVWLMDEASAFLSPSKRENAEAIYQTLRTSAASRFGTRWRGFIISYPRHADDFTCTKLRGAGALGIYGDGPAATWEVNGRIASEPRVRVRDREVPASFANDFRADFEEALSRFCCEPPLARDAFFRFPERLRESVVAARAPLIDWEPVEIVREQGDGAQRRLRGVRLTRLGKLPEGTRLYVHGDPGLSDDSFALALAYAAPATIMLTVPAAEVLGEAERAARGLGGEDPIAWERDVVKTVVVGVIVWRPDRRSAVQVDLQNVEDTILELRRAYPSIGHWPRKRRGESKPRPTLTFDHWNSALTIQRMSGRRMNVKDEAWTRDFQLAVYRNARSCFYNGLVELPDTPAITSADPLHPGAMYELERIELIDGSKIDHPERGSKDIADAVVRVIQHATEHNTAGMGFAHALGHASEYSQTGPLMPVSGKVIDPSATETIGERLMREGRRIPDRSAECPLGELVPAAGTVNGQRLGFGSLNGKG